MLDIINEAAEVYRGAIPADCWQEPYMSADELGAELHAGVEFWGYEQRGALIGIMGTQAVRFYERHGFTLLEPEMTRQLLKTYWRIGERQIETSVVLANPSLHERA